MSVPKVELMRVVVLSLFILGCCQGIASAADFTFQPRVFGSAEYNDNVEEKKGGKGDYVGILRPGVSLSYDHPRIFMDLSYDLTYKKYLDKVLDDKFNHDLSALMRVEAIEELFFVEVTDTFRKVYQDSRRGDIVSGDTDSIGTTDQNTFGLKPYFTIPVTDRTTLTTGAEFQDIWYSEENNVDKRNYSAFADVDHELTDRWELMLGAGYEKQDPRWEDGGYQRYNLMLGTRYTYAEESFVEVRFEPTYTDFELDTSEEQYNPYYVGVTHAFTPTLSGTISSAMEFSEDPQSANTENKFIHQASLTSEYDRGSFNVALAYNDFERKSATSRETYWRPSLGGSHDLAERISFVYSAYANLYTNPDSDKDYFTLLNLNYSLTEMSTMGLSYRFKLRDEIGNQGDYTSNSFGLTVSWRY